MSPQSNGPTRRTPPRRPAPRRLPAAVYWRRRAIVFGTPLVLLIAIIAMFSGGGSKPAQASLTGNTTPPRTSTSTPSRPVSTTAQGQAVNPAAMPSGPCPASSIQVTPSVTNGIAGGPINVDLALATTQTACNFTMSGSNVAIKISSSSHSLWTSQDCANVVPTGTLILRNAAPVNVSLSWDGHESNGSCGAANSWVYAGSYQVMASVIGSTPTTSNFSLKLPTAKTVTQTATPKPTAKATAKATSKSTPKPTAKATKTCGDSCP